MYGEPGAYRLAHPIQGHQEEPRPVLQAAAELVLPAVFQRREELVEEPAVAGMHHYHAKPRPLGDIGCGAIGIQDLIDQLLGHLQNLFPGRQYIVAGAISGAALFFMTADAGQAGVFTAMGQLNVGYRSIPGDGPGSVGQRGEHMWVVQTDLPVVGLAGGRMDNALPKVTTPHPPLAFSS